MTSFMILAQPSAYIAASGSTTSDATILAAIITASAALLAALAAGTFSVITSRRAAKAGQELELYKQSLSETTKRIDRESSLLSQLREQRTLPFLQLLDRVVVASYSVVQIPDYYINLCGRVPELRSHADSVLIPWTDAFEELSNERVNVLLGVPTRRVERILQLLAELVAAGRKIIEGRALRFTAGISGEDLQKRHDDFVNVCYRLMLEVRDATLENLETPEPLRPEQAGQLIKSLIEQLYHGGVVAIPFGTQRFNAWIAIWDISTGSAMAAFVESMTSTSHQEYEEKLGELARHIYEMDSAIDSQLMRVDRGESSLYCMVVRFDGPASFQNFLSETLPSLRRDYPQVWAAFRYPYEIIVAKETQTTQPESKTDQKAAPRLSG